MLNLTLTPSMTIILLRVLLFARRFMFDTKPADELIKTIKLQLIMQDISEEEVRKLAA